MMPPLRPPILVVKRERGKRVAAAARGGRGRQILSCLVIKLILMRMTLTAASRLEVVETAPIGEPPLLVLHRPPLLFDGMIGSRGLPLCLLNPGVPSLTRA